MRFVLAFVPMVALVLGVSHVEAKQNKVDSVVLPAADFLTSAQGWYPAKVPTDMGVQERTFRNGWEWRRGLSKAAPNVTGIVATAILEAYEHTGEEEMLDHALLYGMTLLNDFRDPRSLTLPYRADIAFLARLSDVTGDSSYREAAAAWFGNLGRVSPTGEAEVRRMLTTRRGSARPLVGYEVAFGIHAAIGVGDIRYASELADAVWSLRGEWMTDPSADAWDALSRAALIRAFDALDADRYGPAADALTRDLLRAQRADGSWGASTQSTAYALRALSAGSDRSVTVAPAARAARWMAKTQRPDGTWPENAQRPEANLEAQAEALSAYLAYLGRS